MGLALDELKGKQKTVTVRDVELLIAENVLPYTRGCVIDYPASGRGEGFTISAASARC